MKFETLAYGYGLIEGPRVDAAGNLYFSESGLGETEKSQEELSQRKTEDQD